MRFISRETLVSNWVYLPVASGHERRLLGRVIDVSGSELLRVSDGDGITLWRIVNARQPTPISQLRNRSLQLGVFCFGLLATACVGSAIWQYDVPDTVISTRILVNGATDASARAALSEIITRFSVMSNGPLMLQDDGLAIVVTTHDQDPEKAAQHSRSLVDAILNAPISALSIPTLAPSMSHNPWDDLLTDRARLVRARDVIEAQSIAVSTSLATLVRDTVLTRRTAVDHRPGREVLDKGNTALADLLLQRLQLVSKYQDSYPAVLALDGQIRNLRVFLMDETHRIETKPIADSADAMLTVERDRLNMELAHLDDRRRTLASEIGRIDDQSPMLSMRTVPPPVAVPQPILVSAATARVLTENDRVTTVQILVAAGIMISAALGLLLRPRRRSKLPQSLMLEQVRGDVLSSRFLSVTPETTMVILIGTLRERG
jgi:hypothetical protein